MGTIRRESPSQPHPGPLAQRVSSSSTTRAPTGCASAARSATAGYDVYDAEDGSEAWARLQKQHFDVVVSDRQMPGTDGIELCRLVRAHPDTSRIPVIMVSAMDGPSDREVGLAAGAVEYIAKSDERAMPALLHSVEILTRAIRAARRPAVRARADRRRLERGAPAVRAFAQAVLRDEAAVGSIAEARAHGGGRGAGRARCQRRGGARVVRGAVFVALEARVRDRHEPPVAGGGDARLAARRDRLPREADLVARPRRTRSRARTGSSLPRPCAPRRFRSQRHRSPTRTPASRSSPARW